MFHVQILWILAQYHLLHKNTRIMPTKKKKKNLTSGLHYKCRFIYFSCFCWNVKEKMKILIILCHFHNLTHARSYMPWTRNQISISNCGLYVIDRCNYEYNAPSQLIWGFYKNRPTLQISNPPVILSKQAIMRV